MKTALIQEMKGLLGEESSVPADASSRAKKALEVFELSHVDKMFMPLEAVVGSMEANDTPENSKLSRNLKAAIDKAYTGLREVRQALRKISGG